MHIQSLPPQPLQGPIPSLCCSDSLSESAIWTPHTVGVNGSAGLHKTDRALAFIIHQAVHSTPLDYLHTLL